VEYLDIVNEDDEIIGKTSFEEAHKNKLRHRSVQIFIFHSEDRKMLLIAKRSKDTIGHPSKFCPSACGHVQSGQTYLEAAKDELLEELFSGRDKLPESIVLKKISRYNNDYKDEKENTCLFFAKFSKDFSINTVELEKVFWKNINDILIDVKENPQDYTPSFLKAIEEYSKNI
jgi:isopentenyldiphosphate isomerase|tara:strand:+ start:2825 stop:3343 length:519 start_codon:yes stop_codon:yes gene_type:complete